MPPYYRSGDMGSLPSTHHSATARGAAQPPSWTPSCTSPACTAVARCERQRTLAGWPPADRPRSPPSAAHSEAPARALRPVRSGVHPPLGECPARQSQRALRQALRAHAHARAPAGRGRVAAVAPAGTSPGTPIVSPVHSRATPSSGPLSFNLGRRPALAASTAPPSRRPPRAPTRAIGVGFRGCGPQLTAARGPHARR